MHRRRVDDRAHFFIKESCTTRVRSSAGSLSTPLIRLHLCCTSPLFSALNLLSPFQRLENSLVCHLPKLSWVPFVRDTPMTN
jgi:hypothetical protein